MRREELADAAESYIRGAVMAGAPVEAAAALESEDVLAPIVATARSRFLGVGAAQYQISETEQSFERSTVGTMLVGKIEEQIDDLNYSTMIDILIERRTTNGPISLAALLALRSLRRDLREAAYLAATSAALMHRHIDRLVEIGEYERRSEGDYIAQLAAECDEAGAPMRGSGVDASGMTQDEAFEAMHGVTMEHAALEALREAVNARGMTTESLVGPIDNLLCALNGAPPTFETPEGLDAIAGEYEASADEIAERFGPNVAFVGLPEPEYAAGRAYIRAFERIVADLGPAGDEVLANIRAEVAESDEFDERALAEWFTDGGAD